MYADRDGTARGVKPGSLAVAITINGAMIAAVMLAAPEIIPIKPPGALWIEHIPLPPPPPTPPLPEQAKPLPLPRTTHPRPVPPDPIEQARKPVDVDATLTLGGTSGFGVFTLGTDGGVTIDPPVPPPPAIVDARLDERYAGRFQPNYPPQERRLERDGQVVVRVLIGVDGRVQRVERVSATSDEFFAETERAALARWRFRPGTRGGIPVEQWKTMRVTFHLQDG